MTSDIKKSIAVIVLISLIIVFLFSRKQPAIMPQDITNQAVQTSESTSAPSTPSVPNVPDTTPSAKEINYVVTLKTTKGDIEITLNKGQTPNTVANFAKLAKSGFYNNTIFHRVIDGFMIQGGDPTGTGSGGPGYKFADEKFTGEYTRGTIAMANSGPNTNGSQFFIMHADYPLPKNYTIFGHVTKGLEVVDAIAEDQVALSPSGENSKPVNPTKILSAEVVEVE